MRPSTETRGEAVRPPIAGAALAIKEGRVLMLVDHHGIPAGVQAVVDVEASRYGLEANGRLLLDVRDAQETSIRMLESIEEICVFERLGGGDDFMCHPSVKVTRRAIP